MRNQIYVQSPTNWLGVSIKIIAVLFLVAITSFGFVDRVKLLLATGRWFTLVFYVGIWSVSAGALVIASLQSNKKLRVMWALILSASAAVAVAYTAISGSSLSVFDALSLWTARHEADRAFAFYQDGLIWPIAVFLLSFTIIAAPPVPKQRWVKRGLDWLFWTPAVPVLLIAAIVVIKEGGGSQAMPAQFQPMAVGLITAYKTITRKPAKRQKVTMVAGKTRPVKHIVMLIDESVRPDYFSWKPGNPYSPVLAANKTRIINFGNAVSGGNCSSYSNAILRLGGTRKNMVHSITSNPSIWQYAKAAGYRTIYIDGQSGLNKDPGMLQNFMSLNETGYIDRIYRFEGIPSPQLDFELLAVMAKELASDKPVFIYANKNGAHFPYDEGYPQSQIVFEPTVTQAANGANGPRVNSYLNVLRWSVDHFFEKLFTKIDLKKTAIIYTSDHGQALHKGQLTHCTVEDPDPREGLVPMFALTDQPDLRARFINGAALNQKRASHFAIRPTVLELMGYNPAKVQEKYGPALFVAGPADPQFTSGDVFGVFRKQVRWSPIDLEKNLVEFNAPPVPSPRPMVQVNK